jgi:CBS domain-containing protein
VTDRDLVVRGLAGDADVSTANASSVMSDDVFYCFDDQDCVEVADNMAELQVRRLPVVNREKQLVGTIALGDLERAGAEEAARKAHSGITQDL